MELHWIDGFGNKIVSRSLASWHEGRRTLHVVCYVGEYRILRRTGLSEAATVSDAKFTECEQVFRRAI